MPHMRYSQAETILQTHRVDDEGHPCRSLFFLLHLYQSCRNGSGPFLLLNELVSGRSFFGKRVWRLHFSLRLCDLAAIPPSRRANAGCGEVPYCALRCLDGKLVPDGFVAEDVCRQSSLTSAVGRVTILMKSRGRTCVQQSTKKRRNAKSAGLYRVPLCVRRGVLKRSRPNGVDLDWSRFQPQIDAFRRDLILLLRNNVLKSVVPECCFYPSTDLKTCDPQLALRFR